MKKLGISVWYSTILRITGGILAVYIFKIFNFHFSGEIVSNYLRINHYNSFFDMLLHSIYNASVLALKIIVLISVIIAFMDFIKIQFFKNKNISAHFSIITGLILGITYGAGILIKEKEKLSKKEILFIGTFLMICHSVIEDTALFAIFGASIWILISIRLILAIIISYLVVKLYK
jgi:succinate dehydrogenase/fumarate reductase cytochrome b subunit